MDDKTPPAPGNAYAENGSSRVIQDDARYKANLQSRKKEEENPANYSYGAGKLSCRPSCPPPHPRTTEQRPLADQIHLRES